MSERLVIGIGNPVRGDDGVGPAVIHRIRGVKTSTVSDCSDLIELWRDLDDVVVVDAVASGARAGTIHVFDAVDAPLPTPTFTSTHAFGLPAAVELSRVLGRLPRSLVVYGIEAAGFENGCELTEPVRTAIEAVVGLIESETG